MKPIGGVLGCFLTAKLEEEGAGMGVLLHMSDGGMGEGEESRDGEARDGEAITQAMQG